MVEPVKKLLQMGVIVNADPDPSDAQGVAGGLAAPV